MLMLGQVLFWYSPLRVGIRGTIYSIILVIKYWTNAAQ